ncbi:MAG: ribonuclease P protein component [Rhodocyclaceae bacterium]|nr:ribonuclease P protein component [Rhodocyclaceae bacterium]
MNNSAHSADGSGFGRQCRLLTPAEFSGVFSARQVLRATHFVLHYRRNEVSGARLGLVIPKKQARTAVLRNAIKRQARELFRHRRSALPPLDLVLRLAQSVECPGGVIDRQAKAAWRAEIAVLFERLCQKITA